MPKKNNNLQRGLISGIIMIFIVAGLLLLNSLVSRLDWKYDLTREKLYTLSEQTKEIINNLDQKINIYALFSPEDNNNLIMKNLLEDYKSENINLEYKNPEKYPEFAKTYETDGNKISEQSIIVASEKKFKVIDSSSLVSYEYDYSDMSNFKKKIKSIDLEPEVTNAIRYVTSDTVPVIYKLIGHGEKDLTQSYKKQISLANYEIKDLNLILEQKIPDDCEIIFITTPEKDWTDQESDLIEKFLLNKSGVFFMDYSERFNNITRVAKKFGFEFGHTIILEDSSENFIGNNNAYLVPNYAGHSITHNLEEKKYKLLITFCQNIFVDKAQEDKIKIILESSKNSFGKINLRSNLIDDGDPVGPLNIAIAREENKAKLVAVGSESLLDENINSYIAGTNCDFVISVINWLSGDQEVIYIPVKTHEATRVNFNHRESLILALFSIIILPLSLFLAGIFVIRSRRLK